MTESTLAYSNAETSSSELVYPRAAVSVAVRCTVKNQSGAYYLMVQRGKAPNKGVWSFPGGKVEIGETAFSAGQRELFEETKFAEQDKLSWYKGTFSTADSIVEDDDGSTAFHYLIAVCFAELEVDCLPDVTAADDAADARWWSLEELKRAELKQIPERISPGLNVHIERAESLYQKGAL